MSGEEKFGKRMSWSRAFAIQAQSDLRVRVLLMNTDADKCHQLHYLQMACEKLCKAYLIDQGKDVNKLQSSHDYVAKNLPIVLKIYLGDVKGADWIYRQFVHLAREINTLAPAVRDGGQRLDNCEYPWPDGNSVQIPAKWSFPNLNLLETSAGITLLKLISVAVNKLA